MNKIVMRIVSISFTMLVCVLIVIGLYRIGTVTYEFGYRVYTEKPVSSGDGQDILVQVSKDTSSKQLSKMLEEKGLIRDSKLFYVQLELSAYRRTIKPGVYTLNTSMDAEDMLKVMSGIEEKDDAEKNKAS